MTIDCITEIFGREVAILTNGNGITTDKIDGNPKSGDRLKRVGDRYERTNK